jgi:tRNA(fMet)-specific endonuclease VapC
LSLRYLLDTNVLSEPFKKNPNPGVMRRLEEHWEEVATAAPVLHELLFGCYRLPRSKRRTELEEYLDSLESTLPILPYDQRAADWHALGRARLGLLGKTPPFFDGQIAAVAQTNELVLVTGNTGHFVHFEDLRIEDWTAEHLQ